MNKKAAEFSMTMLIVLLILLVTAAILAPAIWKAVKNFVAGGDAISSCGGVSSKGEAYECVATANDCDGTVLAGVPGCPKDKSLCCAKTASTSGGVVDAYKQCSGDSLTGTWTDCNKCRVKMARVALDPPSPKAGQPFKVYCYSNRENVPCYNTPTITRADGTPAAGSCSFETNSNTKNYAVFDCAGFISGTYEATCSLKDGRNAASSCCIYDPLVDAKATLDFEAK